jgi:hypothetical protein
MSEEQLIDRAPRFEFFREGCRGLALNAINLMELAGLPSSIVGIVMIVESLPRSGGDLRDPGWRERTCCQTLRLAFFRCTGTELEARFRAVFEYFTHYIPARSPDALDMMAAAFDGAMSAMSALPFTVNPEPKRRFWKGWRQ